MSTSAPVGPAVANALVTVIYLHTDHLGSVSMATDAWGNVVSRQEYDPWGKVRTGANPGPVVQTKLNYTGQKLDGTGLLYYGARYYDPGLGRFVSPDSIVPNSSAALQTDFHEAAYKAEQNVTGKRQVQSGPKDSQELNRYSYVGNNPLLHTDLTGHCRDENGNVDETCSKDRVQDPSQKAYEDAA